MADYNHGESSEMLAVVVSEESLPFALSPEIRSLCNDAKVWSVMRNGRCAR